MKDMKRTLGALVGGLLLLGGCGGPEEMASAEQLPSEEGVVTKASCQNYAKQFNSCVNQANLLGLATCPAGQTRTSYSLLGACSNTTYKAITWTCCPQ